MFNRDFYPTPDDVIDRMIYGIDVSGKVILEPSAGKGNIVDYLHANGAKEVITCELNKELNIILQSKSRVIAHDFLTLKSDDVSHINLIIGNPPFSADDKHILHAYNIAPPGCTVVMLCNYSIYKNPYTKVREQLWSLIRENGKIENLGNCFDNAERTTNVEVGCIHLKKPGNGYDQEFEGFFMQEEVEAQENGIMPYSIIRDLVNRYVAAVKLFDEQTDMGVRMNQLTSTFFSSELSFSCSSDKAPILRKDFRKDLQKSAWRWVFSKMNMQKYTTKGLMDDINKFVEKQNDVPFTMRNIYKMIEIVVNTTDSRMDRAIIEVFDKLTSHYKENRYNVEGWATNSHYLVNEKFIMPGLCTPGFKGQIEIKSYRSSNYELVEDMAKALCFLTRKNYDEIISLQSFIDYRYLLMKDGHIVSRTTENYSACFHRLSEAKSAQKKFAENGVNVSIHDRQIYWGEWFEWSFFEIKCYKKGTAHMKFKDRDIWALFNQNVSRIKGYPLPEGVFRKEKTKKAV